MTWPPCLKEYFQKRKQKKATETEMREPELSLQEPMMAEEALPVELVGATPPSRACHKKFGRWLWENLLLNLTILGVVVGCVVGFTARASNPSDEAIRLVNVPGELLMRMLKMLILPLIISSIISGLSALDAKSSGRMGSYAMIYYMLTTLLATIVGIACVLAIHPGNSSLLASTTRGHSTTQRVSSLDAFLDLMRNLFPDNLVRATFQQVHTKYIPKEGEEPAKAVINGTLNYTSIDDVIKNITIQNGSSSALVEGDQQVYTRVLEHRDAMNVLGLIVFSVVFGVILSQMGDKASVVTKFFNIINEIIMRMVRLVMMYAPIGIMFLIAGKIMSIEDLVGTASKLGLYMVTVITGLVIHAAVILPLMYLIVTRKNPFIFFRGILHAWVTALATASSAATLPITVRCVEENNNVDRRISRFILPLGATVNMDGSALYEAVTAIFIAQLNGVELGAGQVVTVSLVATLASIGNASVPHAALVTIVLVLTAVGLPTSDIGLVFAVDWLLDRIRTAVNVEGDAFGSGILAHVLRLDPNDDVTKLDVEENNQELEEIKSESLDDKYRNSRQI